MLHVPEARYINHYVIRRPLAEPTPWRVYPPSRRSLTQPLGSYSPDIQIIG